MILESARESGTRSGCEKTRLVIPLDVGGVVGDCICDPKVNQFKLSTDENKICWFEIGMDDLLLVNNLYSLKHLVATGTTSTYRAEEEERKRHYLLPVVGDPNHVEWLSLLILEKPCKVFARQRPY
jgi:hypothetical protein